MQKKHAEMVIDSDATVTLRSLSDDARILVNGSVLLSEQVLHHNDRLVLGSTQRWLFRKPRPTLSSATFDDDEITYEFFLQEVATKAGLNLSSPILGKGDYLLSIHPFLISSTTFLIGDSIRHRLAAGGAALDAALRRRSQRNQR